MYVCMYLCLYVCMYLCMYVCMYVCVCVYACMHACMIARGTAQKGLVLEKNALNRLVHNLLELISKGYNPTDLSQQPSCNFPGKQIKILFHNLYVD